MDKKYAVPILQALRFYWVVAVSGGLLMALEILAIRVLSPNFGNSVYVWGSIISVFLAALSLGYYWGGRLADRHPSLAFLGRLLAFAGLCQVLLLETGTLLSSKLGEWTGNSPGGSLLATAVLFGPATVLFATVSPFAIRLAAQDLSHLGNLAGRLYALSTAGSLVGTLGCAFLLIPFLDLREILGLLLALTAATSAVALIGSLRGEMAAGGLVAALLAFSAVGARSPETHGSGAVYKRITPYQTLEVFEADGMRFLRSDGFDQTAIYLETGEPGLPYPRVVAAAVLLHPEMESMLVLGLGGGTTGRYLQRRMPHLRIDYIELDPAVVDIAHRFFMFQDAREVQVRVGDGRSFLARSQKKWDFIFSDTYIGLTVPFHLTTIEFFQLARDHLSPDGVFAVNLAAGLTHPFARSVYATITSVFQSSYVFGVPRASNIVILATNEADMIPQEQLMERARSLDLRWQFDPPFGSIARYRLPVELDLSSIETLSDAYAPTDRLIHLKPVSDDGEM